MLVPSLVIFFLIALSKIGLEGLTKTSCVQYCTVVERYCRKDPFVPNLNLPFANGSFYDERSIFNFSQA
jgi:hypothetical protein